VVNRLGANKGAHRSACPQGTQRFGGIVSRQLVSREPLQDGAALIGGGVDGGVRRIGCDRLVVLGRRRVIVIGQAKGSQQGLDPSADGGVGDAELAFEVLQVAA
jgi:hypothetical protein